jgi:hypothetical protein
MKSLVALWMFFSVVSCAHQHKDEKHHHHEETNSIPSEDHGDGRFTIRHKGETYYFDNESDFTDFELKIKNEKKRPKCSRRGRQLVCEEQ